MGLESTELKFVSSTVKEGLTNQDIALAADLYCDNAIENCARTAGRCVIGALSNLSEGVVSIKLGCRPNDGDLTGCSLARVSPDAAGSMLQTILDTLPKITAANT